VEFIGERAVTTPLTWGQRTTWDDIQYFLPATKGFFVIDTEVPVPPGLSTDEVLAEIGELLCRHEVLRTLITADGPNDPHRPEDLLEAWQKGQPIQKVQTSGRLGTAIVELKCPLEDLPAEALAAIVADIIGTWFDHATELPVRAGVLEFGGAPVLAVLGVSHAAADLQGVAVLGAELTNLMTARAEGSPRPPRTPTPQPADLAAFESSDRGRRMNEAALAHIRGQLDVIPPTMFAPPGEAASPRYWRGNLDSRAVPPALNELVARYRVGRSEILLAMTVALLHGLTGATRCTLGLVHGNRSTAELRRAATSLSQTVPTTVNVPDAAFGDLVRNAWSAAYRAYVRGRFDSRAAAALVAEAGARRGIEFDLTCRFNDMWSWRGAEALSEEGGYDPQAVRTACEGTKFAWAEKTDLDKITFFVEIGGDPETVRLGVLADTARIPPDSIRAYLFGFEQALVALAEREMCVAHVIAASGLAEMPHLGPADSRPRVPAGACRCPR
jgi:hypothetical protein